MPNRKYRCPQEGELVTVKQKFLLCCGNAMDSAGHKAYKTYGVAGLKPEFVSEGTALMFLGICQFVGPHDFSGDNKYVYRFLADGRVMYSEPTFRKPKSWLPYHVRVVKNGVKT